MPCSSSRHTVRRRRWARLGSSGTSGASPPRESSRPWAIPLGRAGSWLAGPDFTFQTSHFRGDKNFRAGVWALLMDRQDAAGDKSAAGFRVDYPNDLWDIALSSMRVGDGFDPSLGFVPRRGMYNHRFQVTNTPKRGGWLRQTEHESQTQVITDLNGNWESYREMLVPINWGSRAATCSRSMSFQRASGYPERSRLRTTS